MEERIFLILIYTTELAYVLLGMVGFFGGKVRRKWLITVPYVGYVLGISLMNVSFTEKMIGLFGMISSIMVYGISIATIYSENDKRYRWVIGRLLVLIYADELLFMCINDILILCNVETSEYGLYLPVNIIGLFLVTVIMVLHKKYNFISLKMDYVASIRKIMIPLLIIFAGEMISLTVWMDVLLEERTDRMSRLMGMGESFLVMLGIGVFAIIVLYVKGSSEKLEMMLAMEKEMHQYREDYYKLLLEKEAATKRYRHDMQAHMICLGRFIKDGDIEGAREYVNQMNEEIQRIKDIVLRTGVEILDVLLNHYRTYISDDINLTVGGKVNCELAVSDADQCTIFSNLIRNAIEALQHVTESPKELIIMVSNGSDNAVVTIMNSVNAERIRMDAKGRLQTTKEDKRNHGIGMSNVEEAVLKNNGKISYEIENKQFVCEVVLPIKGKSNLIQ